MRSVIWFGFAVAAFASCRSPAPPEAPRPRPLLDGNSFVVANVRVFDGERVIERADVVVRGGRIAAIGSRAHDLPVVDGTGRTLLPGLIDAHAHVGSERGLRDALRFGWTTAPDLFPDVAYMRRPRRAPH